MKHVEKLVATTCAMLIIKYPCCLHGIMSATEMDVVCNKMSGRHSASKLHWINMNKHRLSDMPILKDRLMNIADT